MDADSPDSSLSSHASSEFLDAENDSFHNSQMPSSKRQKVGEFSYRSTPQMPTPDPKDWDISSDSSGDVPNSPVNAPSAAFMQDDDQPHEQVTMCRWKDCEMGDCGDMDALVQHIHDDHIGVRQKKYSCEWEGCGRIGTNHASGYALRAHMRSHTREKPFYCALPECDRAFTRSDALAKHMRTVHETEALRPSDPVPSRAVQSTPQSLKPQRLKLIVNKPGGGVESNGTHGSLDSTKEGSEPRPSSNNPHSYPLDIGLEPDELKLPPSQLFRLLRRQVHWAEDEGARLQDECEKLDAERKREWQRKELVLTNLEEGELAAAVDNRTDMNFVFKLKEAFLPPIMLPVTGNIPWYRAPPDPAPQ
ncbi:hypothetical protein MMC25_008246 [Agyrium rufum]|nr:hypothetical protein [Agyrium rufum]